MESLSPQVVYVAKLLILNPNEFDLWKMRIEQYFLMTNYSLWEVVLNGDSPAPTRVVEGVLQPVAPTTAEQKLARKNELKAREDINLKFLRSLPSEWKTHTLIWRNKTNLEEQSLDDLFNSFKIYEAEVKSSSFAGTPTQNIEEEPTNYALMAFSSSSSSSDNGVVSCSKACSKAYAQLHSQYDTLTANFRKLQFDVISYQTGLESVEARLLVYKQNESVFEEDIKLLKLESDESWPSSSLYDRFQPSDGYHAVPPPYTGTFMPPKPDLVFNITPTVVETDHSAFNVKLSLTKPDQDLSHTHRPTAPIIEDWVSNYKDQSETKAPQIVPSFVQSTEQVKSPRHSV
uniref:Ribonuclease H-like domain-containing protein n=1 Tax=Tanacetum cinerariifolium TaxID=118510 RepID=A0A6L2N4L5_TANCI|nr:ribonuclease H-like domain-containing protein [Tanacetum cinerariifolium]